MTSIPRVGDLAYAVEDLSLVSSFWMRHRLGLYRRISKGTQGLVVDNGITPPEGYVFVRFDRPIGAVKPLTGVVSADDPWIIYESTLDRTYIELVRLLSED